jgi:hypothetical protein
VSSAQPPKHRASRENPSFTESAQAIEPDAKRLDEITDACRWLIEVNAESLPIIGDSPFRMARAHAYPGGPILRILFTISADDEFCDLWHADQVDDPGNIDEP